MGRDERAEVLRGQVQYYKARSGEYDEWFLRQGRYDRGPEATRRWFEQVDEVRAVLQSLPLDAKSIVELASGTGIWTEQLVDRAHAVTAVDASSEMIELNRRRLGSRARKVDFIEADIFEWSPDQRFDVVIFCFWISHVPAVRLDAFLGQVAALMHHGADLFFVDSQREDTSTARDHVLPLAHEELMTRRLDDGREFTIVKNFWNSEELEQRFARAGLEVRVAETADYFQYGVGTRV